MTRSFSSRAMLLSLAALAALCVAGAFLGADRAGAVFNSPWLAVFWLWLGGLLFAGMWRAAGRRWDLFVTYAGCLFVLAGSLWGSGPAHRLRRALLGSAKVAGGYLVLPPDEAGHAVLVSSTGKPAGHLGFDVRVEGARQPEPGAEAGQNGAGRVAATVAIYRGGACRRRHTLRVNRPLHFGGYHLYLHSAKLLHVVSDTGLRTTTIGLVLVMLGLVCGCWLRPMRHRLKEIPRGC